MERWGEDGYKRKVRNKTKEKEAERKKKRVIREEWEKKPYKKERD